MISSQRFLSFLDGVIGDVKGKRIVDVKNCKNAMHYKMQRLEEKAAEPPTTDAPAWPACLLSSHSSSHTLSFMLYVPGQPSSQPNVPAAQATKS